MQLIEGSIKRPIAVIAAVMLVVLFGLVALTTIPIQLAPDVNRPVITVTTNWFGAAPAEVEREILIPQQDELAGIEGLTDMTGNANSGRARITLEFKIGTNMDRALLLVSNRLDRVAEYPDEADQPTLDAAGSEDNAIAWLIFTRQPGNNRPIHEYGDYIRDNVKERLERVPGVGRVNFYGESEQQIHVIIEPSTLASYGLTIADIRRSLQLSNISLGAGDINEGKRRYVVRTEGELKSLDAVRQVLISKPGDDVNVRTALGDIATVQFGYQDPSATIRQLGRSALAMSTTRQTGSNVIETMAGIREAVEELNQSVIPRAGLELNQVYDETIYINSAIDLVKQNIWVGGVLAVLILLTFLRSLRATIIVSLAIPVSVIGAFVAMAAMGRSLNVISLAGIAFAVGMVVDAAIVVLENIYRHKEEGYSNNESAYRGANQVWGAVLVSALTTVMVFIPILVMELEAGQLFRDIAVAISVAVVLSLVVSITVIPALSSRLLSNKASEDEKPKRMRLFLIDSLAGLFSLGIMAFARLVVKSRFAALLIAVSVTTGAVYFSYQFLPKLEYLPEGNRNLLFGIVIPPPGYNLDTTTEIANGIEQEISHLWVSDGVQPENAVAEKPSAWGQLALLLAQMTSNFNKDDSTSASTDPPLIERFFFVATQSRTFIGAIAEDPSRVAELKPILSAPVFREPGTFGFINQPSIFGRGIGGGRKIDLDISGNELGTVLEVANRAFFKIVPLFPRNQGHEWRPVPGLELGAPEVRVIPDRVRLNESGISAQDLALTVDTFNDGLRATQSTVDGKMTDILIKGGTQGVDNTQGIGNLPIVTSTGRVIPVSSVSDVILTSGPTQIRHRERLRTVTLEVRPQAELPLEAAIDAIRTEVIDALEAEGLPPGVRLRISGTADKLDQTRAAMAVNLALALVIVFLVMAVLFESFVYPLIIMISVPVAAAGGVAGLALLNLYTYQALDMLTMLGFVILVGIVVNNAILLVHQTLHLTRVEGMTPEQAIPLATQNRIRPIFMSTLTSVFGMLPLVFFPGAGSELYRGLGSVVVGGLSLSAIITLLLVPPMMSLLVAPLEARRTRRLASTRLAEA
ncbi:MAG: efflux RND transporter permease subunit [Gammaproteobacteria bacterium]|nr:efflux RND transporter permease subunit [Gammaproteobacteria bacterium]MCY4226844.1 efflux RND transporter permease subunit [Gammaproteobacteria bacterium]